jgi:hypothetical protein
MRKLIKVIIVIWIMIILIVIKSVSVFRAVATGDWWVSWNRLFYSHSLLCYYLLPGDNQGLGRHGSSLGTHEFP